MQEIYVKENMYLYKRKNEIYVSNHQIDCKREPRRITKEATLLAYVKKDHQKGTNKYVLASKKSILLLGMAYLFALKDVDEYKEITQDNIAKEIENSISNLDILNNLKNTYNIINEFQLSNIKCEELINRTLFAEFSSKEEGFAYYASRCIQMNSSLTAEEKSALIEEIQIKIRTFGKYYSAKTMIKALIEYAHVKINIDETTYKSCFKHRGKYGIINCNVAENNAQVLNHELSHAELLFEKMPHFYSEARASYLSKVGYSRVRAIMTLLGNLGNSEQILSHLINNEIDKIWENIINNNLRFQKELNEIRNLLDNINAAREVEQKLKENPQILRCIFRIYESKKGFAYQSDPILMMLKEIANGNPFYESKDHLVLEDNLEVTLHYCTWDISLDTVVIKNARNPYYQIEKTWIDMIQKTLIKELTINGNASSSPSAANYWVRKTMGEALYQQFLRSANPSAILEYLNNQLILEQNPPLSRNDFAILLEEAKERNALEGVKKTNFQTIMFNREWNKGKIRTRK